MEIKQPQECCKLYILHFAYNLQRLYYGSLVLHNSDKLLVVGDL